LVDSSKFDIRTTLVLCPLTRISTLITDTGLSSQARDMVQEAGVKLVTVEAPQDPS
jgi:DeoR family ulaG and ulaABCDEF operon transcriptional repressor